ncbi:MAG: hypothetical protein EAY75_01855 [Bacteroidetes bacterium]|nr:MAG: hypothetical protein EAY75_01855 [Bacteroidota bacterium]
MIKTIFSKLVFVVKHPLFWALLASVLLILQLVEVGQLKAAGKSPGLRNFLRIVIFAGFSVVYFSRYARLRQKSS